MPTYEFKCKQCGRVFEKMLSFKDELPTVCDNLINVVRDHRGESLVLCGGPLQQVYYPVGIKYAAGGFYQNTSDWMDEDIEGTPYDP